MSSCSVPCCREKGCGLPFDIWTISRDNTSSSPNKKSYHICNMCFQRTGYYPEVQKALAMGRFNKQHGNTVVSNGWTFKKNIVTWTHSNIEKEKCFKCSKTDKIWEEIKWVFKKDDCFPYGGYEGVHMCDKHLPKKSLGKNPRVGGWYGTGGGIFTKEETWIE